MRSVFSNFLNLSIFNRSFKGAVVALICVFMLFVNSLPAFAFGTQLSSQPSEGTAQLNQVQQEAREVIKGQPRGMSEVQSKAKGGLNAVQGSADADKMKASGDSSGAASVKDDIEGALESALGQ